MASNTTSVAAAITTAGQSKASGPSVLWALAAIAMNAMLQPSASAYIRGLQTADISAESFWPQRSSPCICVVDAVLDVWIIARKLRRPAQERSGAAVVGSAVVSTRLAIFFIGVLPQAIKLFSMRGVFFEQSIGAAYLLGTLTSMCRALRSEDPKQDYVGHIQDRTQWSLALAGLSGFATTAALLIYTWYSMMPSLGIQASTEVYNATSWLRLSITFFALAYILQHTAFMLLGLKPPIPRYPVIIALSYFQPEIFLVQPEQPKGLKLTRINTITVIQAVVGVSCICAYLLQFVAVHLLRWRRHDQLDGSVGNVSLSGQGEVPQAAITASNAVELENEPESSASQVISPVKPARAGRPRAASESDLASVRADAVSWSPAPVAPVKAIADDAEDGVEHRDSITSNSADAPVAPDDSNDVQRRFSHPAMYPIRLAGQVLGKLAFGLFMCVAVPIALALVLANPDSSLNRDGGSSDPDATSDVPPQSSQTDAVSAALYPLIRVGQFIIMWAFRLLGRLLLAFLSLFYYTPNYYAHKMRTLSKDTLMLAFAIFNFITAGTYLLFAFDGEGTSSPGWAGFLG